MLFEADVGHAFDFQECIWASAAVAGVVADFEVVKVLGRMESGTSSPFGVWTAQRMRFRHQLLFLVYAIPSSVCSASQLLVRIVSTPMSR